MNAREIIIRMPREHYNVHPGLYKWCNGILNFFSIETRLRYD